MTYNVFSGTLNPTQSMNLIHVALACIGVQSEEFACRRCYYG